jgi:hypothetical protein
MVILKLKGHKNLIYLNVDDLKSPKKNTGYGAAGYGSTRWAFNLTAWHIKYRIVEKKVKRGTFALHGLG